MRQRLSLPMFFALLLTAVTTLMSAVALAGGEWTTQADKGGLMAVTPKFQMKILLSPKPNEAVWGSLLIPIKAEQLEAINKHRKDPLFPYIDVAIEVDRYFRTAQGHVLANKLLIETELDVRQWEGLKKGNRLVVRLPDGTEFREPLRGSGKALRAVERRYR